MKKYIKQKLRENWEPEIGDKWGELERDVTLAIKPIIEKYKDKFGDDSYAVIDAVQQIFDGMFQKIKR